MALFNSQKEKRYWLLAGLTLIVLCISLFLPRPLQLLLVSQDAQAAIFLTAMFFTGLAALLNGAKLNIKNPMVLIWSGLIAIAFMIFLRLGVAERTHLIEYSVLTVFIYRAFAERLHQSSAIAVAIYAAILGLSIGILDESVQYFLPHRVFDIEDIVFNGLACISTSAATLFVSWISQKLGS